MTTTVEILKAGKALIESPKNWTQRRYARNAQGEMVAYESENACKFCSVGAVKRAAFDLDGLDGDSFQAETALNKALDHMSGWPTGVIYYNDYHMRKHAEILHLFDRAIQLAEKESGFRL